MNHNGGRLENHRADYCPICRVSLIITEKQTRCPWCKTLLTLRTRHKDVVDVSKTQA